MTLKKEMALVNIAVVQIVTEEDTPKTHTFDTSKEASLDPKVSQGQEKPLRIKNRIVATDKTEDLVIGYDVTLKNSTLSPELLELTDGGKLIYDKTDTTKVIGYEGPQMGKVVNRTKFTLIVFTEEKDADGDILKYAKFTYKHCKGKPVKYSFKDGDFYVPEFKAESRAKIGEKPVKIEFVDTLPELG
jgi:hypothetical protein